MSASKRIIANIIKVMRHKSITQTELSSRTGIVITQMHGYISGRNIPGLDKIELMARALEINMKDLFSEETEIPPQTVDSKKVEVIVKIVKASDQQLDTIRGFLKDIS